MRNHTRRLARLFPFIAIGVVLPFTSPAAFEPPQWAGQPDTEFSEWLDFANAFGEPGNAPDVVASTGDAVLRQHTPGAQVTGTKNIYNPAGASVFSVTDSFARQPEVVVFETRVAGTPLDVDSVRLEFEAGGETVSLATAREVLSTVGTVESRWTWNLRGRDASNLVIRFRATGAHCSLVAARLDVRFKPDTTSVTQNVPAHDRWSYPFNFTPGTRGTAPSFRSAAADGVTRHAFFIVGFDTTPVIEKARGPAAYEIVSARLTATTATGFEVAYDPTFDPVFSYVTNVHPQYVADEDAGRPLELFGTGFRNGITALTWTETTAYAPEQGERSVYPVSWDANGGEIDATMSANNAAPYEVPPFAVGEVATATPGQFIPEEAPVVFSIDLSQPGVVRYLQNALNEGRLMFGITSLHAGAQGGTPTYPIYYTKEALGGDPPKLELEVRLYDRVETVTLAAIAVDAAGGTDRTLRFPVDEGASYGIRWTTDLKSWQLVREPALSTPEAGIAEWVDDAAPGAMKFYQIYKKP